jgi:AcrR family transcriptional regulator
VDADIATAALSGSTPDPSGKELVAGARESLTLQIFWVTLLPMISNDPGFDYQAVRREGDAAARRGLLDVAGKLLAEEGPQALTLRTLAQRANCSTKVVYTLFGGKGGLSEALKVEGFALLRFTVERERRRHRDPVRALLPIMMSYRSFALAHRDLFRVMFGNALPDHVPTDFSRQQARQALGALEEAVTQAHAALGARVDNPLASAVRLWAAVHGPVSLEIEGITPFDTEGEGLTRLAVVDALAGLGLAPAATASGSPSGPLAGSAPITHSIPSTLT